jgi:two-component system phosphate regulon sensor histidine kinase PhoR
VPDIRLKALFFICALSTVCLFIWLISNVIIALLVFAVGLMFYIGGHISWLHKLQTWFKNPDLNNLPEGSGVWEGLFATLLKYERNNINNQKQLNAALERFNLTANAIPDGLILLSPNNEIEWCTPNAEAQLGLDLKTDRNLPIVNLVRDRLFIAHLYNEDYSEPFKLKSWRNPEMLYEIHLIALATKQKLMICRDMTQLEKVDSMRRDFIANVSHELRTPLTVVGGFLETLSDTEGAVPDHFKNYFNLMSEQTFRMRRIIEDLLMLSTIESNIDEPDDTEVDMTKLMKQIQNDALGLSQSLYKTKHKIELSIDSELNILGAQNELQSAFTNLVSNAVRYTPKGGNIRITWSALNDQAIFSVIDSGIGIEQQHIDRLTERFYRVDRGRSRETGGTGLGLSIVKHILIRHQARLEITSEVDVGSTFCVLFPKTRVVKKKSVVEA